MIAPPGMPVKRNTARFRAPDVCRRGVWPYAQTTQSMGAPLVGGTKVSLGRKRNENCTLLRVADALGERAGALAGNVHKAGIVGDLLEHSQQPLGLGQDAAVEVGFEVE